MNRRGFLKLLGIAPAVPVIMALPVYAEAKGRYLASEPFDARPYLMDSADIFAEAKPLLAEWGRELQRDELLEAFGRL